MITKSSDAVRVVLAIMSLASFERHFIGDVTAMVSKIIVSPGILEIRSIRDGLERLNYGRKIELVVNTSATDLDPQTARGLRSGEYRAMISRTSVDGELAAKIALLVPNSFCILVLGVGTEHIPRTAAVQVMTPEGFDNSEEVVELVLACATSLLRRLPLRSYDMSKNIYTNQRNFPSCAISGTQWCIVGDGRQALRLVLSLGAAHVARVTLYHPLMDQERFKVLYRRVQLVCRTCTVLPNSMSFTVAQGDERMTTILCTSSWDDAVHYSDVVSLHVPTHVDFERPVRTSVGMINKKTLAAMKQGAMLINTGRGDLIVEDDVVEALSSGQLAGYATDALRCCVETTRNPTLSPLHRCAYPSAYGIDEPPSNVLITPHVGGDCDGIMEEAGSQLIRQLCDLLVATR